MKIKDIIKEADGKAVITNYQPGKSVEVTMPDGTLIKKDLLTNPNAISKDEQGNPSIKTNGVWTNTTINRKVEIVLVCDIESL